MILYGSVADKDVDAVLHLMPENAVYVFTQASSRRALPSEIIEEKYKESCAESGKIPSQTSVTASVKEGVAKAYELAASVRESDPDSRPLIYIGGSTYVVSEAVELI